DVQEPARGPAVVVQQQIEQVHPSPSAPTSSRSKSVPRRRPTAAPLGPIVSHRTYILRDLLRLLSSFNLPFRDKAGLSHAPGTPRVSKPGRRPAPPPSRQGPVAGGNAASRAPLTPARAGVA